MWRRTTTKFEQELTEVTEKANDPFKQTLRFNLLCGLCVSVVPKTARRRIIDMLLPEKFGTEKWRTEKLKDAPRQSFFCPPFFFCPNHRKARCHNVTGRLKSWRLQRRLTTKRSKRLAAR